MTIVGFDSKQFTRGKTQYTSAMGKDYRYHGFNTQLGVGVSTEQPEKFVEEYASLNEKLKGDFKISANAPFFSSRQLENNMGMSKATSFADHLITGMQKHISSVHFSYVILSRNELPHVRVGGQHHYKEIMPTDVFIDNLGPMFSYLTAHSLLWMHGYKNIEKMELYIDSFRSKFTPAWEQIIDNTVPKIFIKGDECNPYISCADMIAFLTDVKLRRQALDLNVENLEKVWSEYSFGTTTQFFGKKSIPYYSWKGNDNINITEYLTRPIIFLAVDKIELENYGAGEETASQEDVEKPRKLNRIIEQHPIYHAAMRYAFDKGGCLKFFSKTEDPAIVRDGDVFIYAGGVSKRIGETLRDMSEIHTYSGIELRKMIEKE